MFVEPVAMGEVPDTCQRVRDATRKAVRSNMERAVAIEGDVLALFNSDCINQAIEVVDMIRNTKAMESMIKDNFSASPEDKHKALKDCEKRIEAKLDVLSLEMNKDLSDFKRVCLGNLIASNVGQLNYVRHVMIPYNHAYGWPSLMPHYELQVRHSWDNGVKVRCDWYELDYGYEFLGTREMLCITQLTRQAYTHLARAML